MNQKQSRSSGLANLPSNNQVSVTMPQCVNNLEGSAAAQTSSAGGMATAPPQNSSKWALNVEDIIKRSNNQNVKQDNAKSKNQNTRERIASRASAGSQDILNLMNENGQKGQQNNKMNTIQQSLSTKNTINQKKSENGEYNLLGSGGQNQSQRTGGRGKSKERPPAASNMNTIQPANAPQFRKSSQQPVRNRGQSFTNPNAANNRQNLINQKQNLNKKQMNDAPIPKNPKRQNNGANEGFDQVQGGQGQGQNPLQPIQPNKQNINSVLGQLTAQGSVTTTSYALGNQRRGTTPLRMEKATGGKQNQNQNQNLKPGLIIGPNINPRNKSNQQKTKTSNNQQIKGIMAAALASVKANPNLENQLKSGTSILPMGLICNRNATNPSSVQQLSLGRGPQKIDDQQNNMYSDMQEQMQKLNSQNPSSLQNLNSNVQNDLNQMALSDSNDLKILKASSVNRKYMTEMLSEENSDPRQGMKIKGRKAMNGVLASMDDEEIFKQNRAGLLPNEVRDEELVNQGDLQDDIDSEYINTDDDNDDEYEQNNLKASGGTSGGYHAVRSQKLQRGKRKSDERKVLSQHDLQYPMNQNYMQGADNVVTSEGRGDQNTRNRSKSRKNRDNTSTSQKRVSKSSASRSRGIQNSNSNPHHLNRPQTTKIENRSSIDRGKNILRHQNSVNNPSLASQSRAGKAGGLGSAKIVAGTSTTQKPNNKSSKILQHGILAGVISTEGGPSIFSGQKQLISPQPQLSQENNFNFKGQQTDLEQQNQENNNDIDTIQLQSQLEDIQQNLYQNVDLKLGEVKEKIDRHEAIQTQFSQRMDIFEEQIIKRVREIQKYSKGLNQLIRKNVMPDIEHLRESSQQREESPEELNKEDIIRELNQLNDRIQNQNEEIAELANSMVNQGKITENIQVNVETDINNKYGLLDQKIEQLQAEINELDRSRSPEMRMNMNMLDQEAMQEIQQKLVEQNQLIEMLDEQMNNQEQQISNLQQIINEAPWNESIFKIAGKLEQMDQFIQDNQEKNNGQEGVESQQLGSIRQQISESQQNLKDIDQKYTLKIKEVELNIVKLAEEGEGRDGLILQQNQDITNLIEANGEINQKSNEFQLLFQNLEEQVNQISQAQAQNSGDGLNQQQQNQNQLPSVTPDQVEDLVLRTEEHLTQMVQEELRKLSREQGHQMETLRQNQEGRLQICIDTLKEEVAGALQQSQEGLSENIEIVQHNVENFDERVRKAEMDINSLSEQNQNIELQFQAQFDEQSAQAEQQIDRKLQKVQQATNQKLEDLKLSQGIGATQDQFQALEAGINERLTQIENQDKFEIFQAKDLDPIREKMNELQVQIGQRTLELTQHQDIQMSSLIDEIKQIQENLESVQEVVVRTTQDVQELQNYQLSNAQGESAAMQVDEERIKTVESCIASAQSDIKTINEVKLNGIEIRLKGLEAEVEEQTGNVVQRKIESDTLSNKLNNQELGLQQISQRLLDLESKPRPQIPPSTDPKEIERLDRQMQELDLQIKKVYTSCRGDIEGAKKESSRALQDLSDLKKRVEMEQKVMKSDMEGKFSQNEAGLGQLKEVVDKIMPQFEQNQTDILTMKSIINILQDSNFQGQIDNLSEQIDQKIQQVLKPTNPPQRFSMPIENLKSTAQIEVKKSDDEGDEVFASVQKKNPRKKAQAVSSGVRPAKKRENKEKEEKQAELPQLQTLPSVNKIEQIGQINSPSTPRQDDNTGAKQQNMNELTPIQLQNSKSLNPNLGDDVSRPSRITLDNKDAENLEQNIFQETDEDLQNKLQTLFKDHQQNGATISQIDDQNLFLAEDGDSSVLNKIPKEVFAQPINDENLFGRQRQRPSEPLTDNYDDDGFEDDDEISNQKLEQNPALSPSRPHLTGQKQSRAPSSLLYDQDVKLPLLNQQPQFQNQNSNSFINSSTLKDNTGASQNLVTGTFGLNSPSSAEKQDDSISINSINLQQGLSQEQKEELADNIMRQIDFEDMVDIDIDQIINQIIFRS